MVQQVIGALPGATMLEIDVGERAEWKSPDHPLRHDPELKLTGIPTLFAWGTSGAGEKLGAQPKQQNFISPKVLYTLRP